MGLLNKFGIWRISRMVISDPSGFLILFSAHDPESNVEVRFPSGLLVKGDVYVFYGGVETNRSDIPKDGNMYVLVLAGNKEEPVRGLYGREVYVRGKIINIEEKTKEGKKVEKLGVAIPIERGKKVVFIHVVGLSIADTEACDDIEKELQNSISLLEARNSDLQKQNENLKSELDQLKKTYEEIVSKYQNCRSAMDRLYFQLSSRLREAEEILQNAKTLQEVREAAIKMIENLTGEKSIFGVMKKKKEEEELERKLKELKKEAEKI